MKKTRNEGIEAFKWIAALMVIGIHTSPFASMNIWLDFIITHIWFRIAVPFFLMVTGFYIIPECVSGKKKNAWNYCFRVLKIYFVSIILYLPINWYKGDFKELDITHFFKTIITDGTMYHLWYFPALITGIIIVYTLLKIFSLRISILIVSGLYLVGILGDSYYKIIGNIPVLERFYDFIFRCFSYTRNGIFYVPIFLLLGYLLAKKKVYDKKRKSMIFISLVGLTIEGILLEYFRVQRHDSMYFFLVPTMYYLYQIVYKWNVNLKIFRNKQDYTTIIYVFHPMSIIIIRGISEAFKIEIILKNSFLMFGCVTILTLSVSIIGGMTIKKIKKFMNTHKYDGKVKDRAWIELNLDNLQNNYKEIMRISCPATKIMAVVKANAYGHGVEPICHKLMEIGVMNYAVATLDEAIELRKLHIKGFILILGYTEPKRAKLLKKYGLTQTIVDYEYAQKLNSQNIKVDVHIAINTGMNRIGINYKEKDAIYSVLDMKNLHVTGIFTHMCVADSKEKSDVNFTYHQIINFMQLTSSLCENGYKLPIHIQGSYGIVNYTYLMCDYIRPGIILYGCYSDNNSKENLNLKPVLSLKSRIVDIKNINKGQSVGYGRKFVASSQCTIATIAIGYADGIPRNVTGMDVLINGKRAKIIGRICMDQMMIDISDNKDVEIGDEVVLIGKSRDESISAEDFAESCGTITNEVLSRLASRLPRIVQSD